MNNINTEYVDPNDGSSGELKSYATGFVASVVLTVVAFATILTGLPPTGKIVVVSLAAIAQIIVHMRYFLHLSFEGGQAREDLLLLLFSACLLFMMVVGTVWILTDLRGRMHIPVEMEQGNGISE